MKTKEITKMALVAAIMCILGPITIPIGPVPISFTNLILYFSLYILGTKNTVISFIIYYLLGLVGLPVFSGFTGGFAKAVGPTGGYLVGFIFMIIIGGLFISKFKNKIVHFVGMVFATFVAYAFGTVWYCYIAHSDLISALLICVCPFIIGDLIKIILANVFGLKFADRINN